MTTDLLPGQVSVSPAMVIELLSSYNVHVHVRVCVHLHVCMCTCTCMYVYMYYFNKIVCIIHLYISHTNVTQGQIQALESEILHIRFFPGIPQPFKKLIQVLY